MDSNATVRTCHQSVFRGYLGDLSEVLEMTNRSWIPLTCLAILSWMTLCGCTATKPLAPAKAPKPSIQGLTEPPGKSVELKPHDMRRTGVEDYWLAQTWVAKTVEFMSKPDMEAALFALHQAQNSLPDEPGEHAASHEAYSMAVLNGKARTYLLLGESELADAYIALATKKAKRPIDIAVLDQTRACLAYQKGEFKKALEFDPDNVEPLAVMLREAALYRSGDTAAKARLQKFYRSTQNPGHIHMLPADVKTIATKS